MGKGKINILESFPSINWISNETNKGKGYALRRGIQHTEGEIIVYTDYDFPYHVNDLVSMVERISKGEADVLAGIRDEQYYQHISFLRNAISKILKILNGIFLKLPTADSQCGLKAFNEKGKDIFLETKTNRYLVDVEFLKLLSKTPLRVKTHLVSVRPDIVLSEIKNLKLLKEMITYLKILLT